MQHFWLTTSLEDMNQQQWESLCDGCAKCCLHKLEDSRSGELFFTNVVCRYLDQESCTCSEYARRSTLVPDCIVLDKHNLDTSMMPQTCAYRLLSEGSDLPEWHPLVSGVAITVETSGNSIRGRVVSELDADELEYHMIDWIR